jgi:hypothetical protein
MTQPRDIDRLLDQWFADGSSVAPDRVIDIVADRIERQPQRPAWRLDWRHLSMNPMAKAGVAIAAVVLIALVGYNLLPGRSTGVGGPAPTASPTVTPSAAPSAASTAAQPLPDGMLTAGTYVINQIDGVTMTATVPDGWRGIPGFGVTGPNDSDAPRGMAVIFMQASGAFDDPCHWDKAGTLQPDQQPGEKVVGPTVDDLVNDIRANTSYTSTAPVDITIDGHPGKQVDLQLPSDLNFASCDKEAGDTTGQYYFLTPPAPVYAQGPGNRWHLRIVDVDGTRLIVALMDYSLTPASVQAQAQTIVNSIAFSK